MPKRTLFFPLLCILVAAPAGAASAFPPEAAGQRAAAEVDAVAAFIADVQFGEAMDGVERDVGAYVAQVVAQEQAAAQAAAARAAVSVPRAVSAPRASAPAMSAGPGFPSEAFFRILARCEEGGNNDPFYGYFGKIDGAWAGLSWDEQVARARVLWAQNASHISTTWTSVPSCTGPPF